MKRFKISFLLVLMMLLTVWSPVGTAQRDTTRQMTNNDETAEIMEALFVLKQQADAARRRVKVLEATCAQLDETIAAKKQHVLMMEASADRQQSLMGNFLRQYQRMGAGSAVEILLRAQNLSDLIWQINVMKDFSYKMTEQANTLSVELQKLAEENESLAASKDAFEKEQRTHLKQMEEAQLRQTTLNERLSVLQAEGKDYEAQLMAVDASWQVAQTEIGKLSVRLNALRDGTALSASDYSLAFSFSGINVTFSEATLNKLFNTEEDALDGSDVPFVMINCEPDAVQLILDEGRLKIDGQFEIETATSLRFVPLTASYNEMTIEPETLAAIFHSEPAVIDLSSALENGTIKRIEMKEDALSLTLSYFNF